MTATETKTSLLASASPSARWKRAALVVVGGLSAVAIAALLAFASYDSKKSEAFYVFSGMFLSVLLVVLLAVAGALWSRKSEFLTSHSKALTAETGADDRRRHPRFPVGIDAILVHSSFEYHFDCTIIDNSTGGARVVLRCGVFCPDSLPDVILLYDIWNSAINKCEVRWRNDNYIGLRFDPHGFAGVEREQALRECRSIVDRRRHRRVPVSIDAVLVDPSFQYLVDCTIVDNSTGGASVLLRRTDSFPDSLPEVLLLYEVSNSAINKCEVRWRNDNYIGLRFDPHGFAGAEREQALRECRSIVASGKGQAVKA